MDLEGRRDGKKEKESVLKEGERQIERERRRKRKGDKKEEG